MNNNKSRSNSIGGFFVKMYRGMPLFYITVGLFVVASIFVPYFFTPNNIVNLVLQSADIIVIACGLTFVILNGSLDFSIPAVMGLGSILGAMVMNTKTGLMAGSPFATLVGVVVMLAVGLGIGALNGFAVIKLKMPSFMATMASYIVFIGISLYLADSKTISGLPESYMFIGNGKLGGAVPVPILIAAAVLAVSAIVLKRTVFGRNVYAIGTNPKASEVSGLPVKKTVFTLFLISGLCSAIGGIIASSRLGSGLPALGEERLFDFVTAVIIGGVSIFGGAGSVIGAALGGVFITMLNNSLSMLGVKWFVIILFKGVFLLVVATLDAARRYKGK